MFQVKSKVSQNYIQLVNTSLHFKVNPLDGILNKLNFR